MEKKNRKFIFPHKPEIYEAAKNNEIHSRMNRKNDIKGPFTIRVFLLAV